MHKTAFISCAALFAALSCQGGADDLTADQPADQQSSLTLTFETVLLNCGNGKCDGYYDNIRRVYVKETISTCPRDCYCGNGTYDPGERCDNRFSSKPCPTSCSAPSSCTTSTLRDLGPCQIWCETAPIVPCCGDGACNGGESSDTCRVDCYCGNRSLDPGEICDSAITSGAGKCPTSCATGSVLTGEAALCTARCVTDDGAIDTGSGGKPEPITPEGK